MRLLTVALSATLLSASAVSLAVAHDYRVGDIHIEHPWSRATPPTANVAAGYMVIQNEGAQADRLVGASSPRVQTVEIHASSTENGMMQMRHLGDGLEIASGDTVSLEPGSYHMMLIGLDEAFVEGEKVPLTLEFETAGTVETELVVGPLGAPNSGGHAHH